MKNWIRDYIVKNDLIPGAMLPPERFICDKLQVSRTTVVKAMNDLVADGVIIRIQGKGTMVSDLPKRTEKRAKSFRDAIFEQGYQESSKIVDFRNYEDIRTRAVFGNQPETFIMIKRLRYINHIPAVLLRSVIEKDVGEKLLERIEDSEFSFYAIFESITNEPVTESEGNVRILQSIDPEDAKLLDVSPNSANFHITSIGYLKSGKPIEIVEAIFRGDIINLRATNSSVLVNDQEISNLENI